ncbi:MAG: hypothetical protein M1816_003943 [Peltula sp. TS41687]|nr:MAG: hypothetical protein M1816_003943 [Peltula sp. TS41687]
MESIKRKSGYSMPQEDRKRIRLGLSTIPSDTTVDDMHKRIRAMIPETINSAPILDLKSRVQDMQIELAGLAPLKDVVKSQGKKLALQAEKIATQEQ